MAGKLTEPKIVDLGAALFQENINTIALKYLGFENETKVSNICSDSNEAEEFNRNIVRDWIYRNPDCDQVQVRMIISLHTFKKKSRKLIINCDHF